MSNRQPERCVIQVERILTTTGRAVCVVIHQRREWIPRSQVHSVDPEKLRLTVTPWIAQRKGLR